MNSEMNTRYYAVEMFRMARLILGKIDIADLPPTMYEPHRKATLELHDALAKLTQEEYDEQPRAK